MRSRAARWMRTAQAAALALVVIAMLGASASRFDRLGHEMICTCGCTQILLECNHVGCPVSPVMIDELQTRLTSGGTDVAIENWFVAKYGAVVLAAPIRGGFDNVAWIMPLAVFALATVGTGVVIWLWRRRALRLATFNGPAFASATGDACGSPLHDSAEAEALRQRIRAETEYR